MRETKKYVLTFTNRTTGKSTTVLMETHAGRRQKKAFRGSSHNIAAERWIREQINAAMRHKPNNVADHDVIFIVDGVHVDYRQMADPPGTAEVLRLLRSLTEAASAYMSSAVVENENRFCEVLDSAKDSLAAWDAIIPLGSHAEQVADT